ncbi:MAG: hypothetical protein NT023_03160 [Armatimonadetes bacterium]|nr:hypothetical protein [Armatimonadota bacterium]
MIVREPREPCPEEARENLRIIRELMERSTRYSTFSGMSGILAGSAAILGAVLTHSLQPKSGKMFLLIWSVVVVFALTNDYFLTKRKARGVGKHIVSRLGKQMGLASVPGFGMGALLTLFFWQHNLLDYIYPIWMLCYGIAVLAVGLFSQREVSYLGYAFLVAGAINLLLFPAHGLVGMALSFGGLHIIYGIIIGRKDRREAERRDMGIR